MRSSWRARAMTAASTALACACALLIACASGGGREVEIVAGPDACTPTTIVATRGEHLTLIVTNEAGSDREIEGIDGTRLEEVLVPDGRTRRIDLTLPDGGGAQQLKCYIPGGPSTVITVTAD